MWHDVSWSWWWLGMGLWMVAVWAAVIVLAVWAFRRVLSGGSGGFGARAEDVLAERYARGEIDDDEYAHRRAELRSRR